MNNNFDIVLSIVSHRGLAPPTAFSLEKLRQVQNQLGFTYHIGLFVGDALLSRARSQACTKFLEESQTPYFLFIDDDVAFEPEHIVKIYKHLSSGQYDLIGGIYPVRGASQLSSYGWGGQLTPDGKIYDIEYLATGFMGISRRLLEKMVKELPLPILNEHDWARCYPFFECGRFEHRTQGGVPIYISEDWDFPLVADTKILKNNYQSVALGDIHIGDSLIGLGSPMRSFRPYLDAEVTGIIDKTYPLWRVTTDNGIIEGSPKHPLLVSSPSGSATRWIPISRIQPGQWLNQAIIPETNPITMSRDFQIGYLKGIFEGDGCIEPTHGYATLEMADKEAIIRVKDYATNQNLQVNEIRKRELTNPNWKPLWSIRLPYGMRQIEELSLSGSLMMQGFLSGIYDAEGSYHNSQIRIALKEQKIVDEIRLALHYLGLPYESELRADGLAEFRLSGQRFCFRFWQLTLPAISRKLHRKDASQIAIAQYEKRKVLAIEPVGRDADLRCISTTTGTFLANGFVSHNCEKARKVGIKVYADTSIQIEHLRENLYSVKDVVMNQQKQAIDAQLYGAMNHQYQLMQKINDDLADFLHMSPARVQESIEHGQERLAKEWEDWKGESEDFYKDNTTSLFDLAIFNQQNYYFEQRLGALIQIRQQKILDIGSGLGTAVFVLSEQDNDVTGYDVNKKAIAFADFKKEKHKLKGTFTNEKPDFSQFDIIVAVDTLEHIRDLQGFLLELGNAMKIGAKLYHSDFFPKGEKNTWPMHYEEHQQHLAEWFKEAGLISWDDKWAVKI